MSDTRILTPGHTVLCSGSAPHWAALAAASQRAARHHGGDEEHADQHRAQAHGGCWTEEQCQVDTEIKVSGIYIETTI